MTWLVHTHAEIRAIRRAAGLVRDRHRPGYWRDYHARNRKRRRPYLAKKARQYRARRALGTGAVRP